MQAAGFIASQNALARIPLPTSEQEIRNILAERERRRNRPKPQPGPQQMFLETEADIAIYGGAAGGGKTYAVLLEAMKHAPKVSDFNAVFFRRNTTQIRNPGGLWDASMRVFPDTGALPVSHVLEWRWPNAGKVKFAHLEHDNTVLDWQGSEIPLIVFDELTHFSKGQFWYMMSRNRSMCGVKPYVRATCNPDADSWVAEFIDWWLGPEGFPIMERSGKLRWFIRVSDNIIWADSKEALEREYGSDCLPKSVTFIAARLDDNQALVQADPGYRANLLSLPFVERERLLNGNWKIRPAAGLLFRREWCEVIDTLPPDTDVVRYWDRAATEKTPNNDPDLTCGIKLGRVRSTGKYILIDARWGFYSPGRGDEIIKNTASADGVYCRVGHPQDPGQAGVAQAQAFIRGMEQFAAQTSRESGDKVTRFMPFSSQAEHGNVQVLRGFDEEVLRRLENFPDGRYKDDADACSGAYAMFNDARGQGMRDFMREEAERVTAAREQQHAAANAAENFMRAFG